MKRVLIMEDNIVLALEWQEEFAKHEIDAEVTRNGEDAAAFLSSAKFDLVITDLFVHSGKGGLHVLAKLMDMGFQAPPAIAVTGSFVKANDGETAEEANLFLQQARRLGSSDTIQKPFSAAELVRLSQKYLNPNG